MHIFRYLYAPVCQKLFIFLKKKRKKEQKVSSKEKIMMT